MNHLMILPCSLAVEDTLHLPNVLRARGDLGSALASYRESLDVIDRLAKSNPSNADWQHDLSVSYQKIGYVQQAQGDLAGALRSFRDSLAIRERLARSRSQECRLAARAFSIVRHNRERAAGTGRPCRCACGLSVWTWPRVASRK